MPTVTVVNQQGTQVGELELLAEVFAAEVKEHLLYDVVRMQLARKRTAHPSTRNRARVSGGGKKPYRQKGTGRARQGSTRSPHFKGGGVVFGPNGRKYELQLNKKVRAAALRSALSLRLANSELVVVDGISLAEPRTRRFVEVARALSAERGLFVYADDNANLVLAARNLPTVKTLSVVGLNVLDILRHPKLVLTKPAVELIQARLAA